MLVAAVGEWENKVSLGLISGLISFSETRCQKKTRGKLDKGSIQIFSRKNQRKAS